MDFDALADHFEHKPTAECIDELEQAGLVHLGSGSSREVFEIPSAKRVVKFSRGNVYQNRNEVNAWQNAPDDLKAALLPVESYAGDYRWVVMPKAKPASPAPENVRAILDKVRHSDWNCKDKNPENIGWYQGELVLMDYGSGCGPSGLGKPY